MKTRIKKIEYNNGDVEFVPQRKREIEFSPILFVLFIRSIASLSNLFWECFYGKNHWRVNFKTEKEAKDFIDQKISDCEANGSYNTLIIWEKTVKSKTYIKYP